MDREHSFILASCLTNFQYDVVVVLSYIHDKTTTTSYWKLVKQLASINECLKSAVLREDKRQSVSTSKSGLSDSIQTCSNVSHYSEVGK